MSSKLKIGIYSSDGIEVLTAEGSVPHGNTINNFVAGLLVAANCALAEDDLAESPLNDEDVMIKGKTPLPGDDEWVESIDNVDEIVDMLIQPILPGVVRIESTEDEDEWVELRRLV